MYTSANLHTHTHYMVIGTYVSTWSSVSVSIRFGAIRSIDLWTHAHSHTQHSGWWVFLVIVCFISVCQRWHLLWNIVLCVLSYQPHNNGNDTFIFTVSSFHEAKKNARAHTQKRSQKPFCPISLSGLSFIDIQKRVVARKIHAKTTPITGDDHGLISFLLYSVLRRNQYSLDSHGKIVISGIRWEFRHSEWYVYKLKTSHKTNTHLRVTIWRWEWEARARESDKDKDGEKREREKNQYNLRVKLFEINY